MHLLKYVTFGKRSLPSEARFEFESKAEMDAVLADTEFDLLVGLGATHEISLHACKWREIHSELWLEDLISVKATFDAIGPIAIQATA